MRALQSELLGMLPLDAAFVSPKALEGVAECEHPYRNRCELRDAEHEAEGDRR